MSKIRERVAILVVSYNGLDSFQKCIKSLEWVKNEMNIELFVTDNASDTNNLAWLRENYSWIKSKQNSFNGGFAYGVNRTYNLAKGFLPEFVLLLNPDTEISKEAIVTILESFNDEKTGIVGPRMVDAQGVTEESAFRAITLLWLGTTMFKDMLGLPRGKNRLIRTSVAKEVPSVSGGCMMVRTELINKIGFLDEDYFMYVEDNDFCYRARKDGWKVIYDPTATVFHVIGDSVKTDSDGQKSVDTLNWYKERVYLSNLIFFKKNKSETEFNTVKAGWKFGMKIRIMLNKDKDWAIEMMNKIDNIKYLGNG